MEIAELINTYGQTAFSMAVAWFCLTRLDKNIKSNNEKLDNNTAVMNRLISIMEGKEDTTK